jgi:hypothetical protein
MFGECTIGRGPIRRRILRWHIRWRLEKVLERSEERGHNKFCYSEIRNFMKYFLGWETVDLELVDLYCYQIFFSTIHCNL